MTDQPERLQGGVFVWICALFAVVDAVGSLADSYNGFWEFFFALIATVGFAWLTYNIMGKVIRAHAGSLEGEEGPLWGFVTIGAAAFLHKFYCFAIRYHAQEESFSVYFKVYLKTAFVAACIVFLLLLAGRNLNQHRLGYHKVLRDWSELNEKAKAACVVVLSIFVTAVLIVFVDILLYGLRFNTWAVLGDSIYSAGVFLFVLSFIRPFISNIVVRYFVSKVLDISRYCPEKPWTIRQDSFTVPEYGTTVLFAGLEISLFVTSPQLFKCSYLIVLPICTLACLSVLILIYWLDREHLASVLHASWRKECTEFLLSYHTRYINIYKVVLKERALERFKEVDDSAWENVTLIRNIADDARRSLNMRFCEEGKMKYILHYDIFGKRESFLKYIGRVYDEKFDSMELGSKVRRPEDMPDEQLLKSVIEFRGMVDGKSIEPVSDDVEKCASILRETADWPQVGPICRFVIAFRRGDSVHNLEILIDERRNVTLSGLDVSGLNIPTRFPQERLLDVLGGVIV